MCRTGKKKKKKWGGNGQGGRGDNSRGEGEEEMLAAFREMLIDEANQRARAPAAAAKRRAGFAHGLSEGVPTRERSSKWRI